MLQQLKALTKENFPAVVRLWRRFKYHPMVAGSPNKLFSDIYEQNKWGDAETRSGAGSSLAQTEEVRKMLPLLIEELGCCSLLDIPCGDFHWMRLVPLEVNYIGGDIVPELVDDNQRRYGNERRQFLHLDLIQDRLPSVDLVLCRDCLVHLSNSHIIQALTHLKGSGSRYLLTTTFVNLKVNENIPTGYWRPLNLQLPPFNFPPPLRVVDEKCPRPEYKDKHLGLWQMVDLPDFAAI